MEGWGQGVHVCRKWRGLAGDVNQLEDRMGKGIDVRYGKF